MSQLVNSLLTFIPELGIVYVQMLLLPIRKRSCFFVLRIAVWTLAMFFRIVVPVPTLNIFFGLLVAEVLLPFVFYRAGAAYRLLAIVVAICIMLASEMVTSFMWMLLTGEPSFDYRLVSRYPVLMVALFAFCALFDVVAARILFRPLRTLARCEDVRGSSRGGTAARIGIGALRGTFDAAGGAHGDFFAVTAVLQTVFVIVLFFVPFSATGIEQGDYCLGLVVLVLLCLAVDLVLLFAMRRYDETMVQEQRASVLAERLHVCLADYDALIENVERTSAIRHDLRNHLQVVDALAERGELEGAVRHLDEVRAEVSALVIGGSSLSAAGYGHREIGQP